MRRCCYEILSPWLSPGGRVSGSRAGRLEPGRFRAEGPRCVALGSLRPGELALARQLLASLFLVVRTRQRREESHEIVNISFRQSERLDVFVEIRILQAIALVGPKPTLVSPAANSPGL